MRIRFYRCGKRPGYFFPIHGAYEINHSYQMIFVSSLRAKRPQLCTKKVMNEYKLQVAELLLRSFTAILFLFQGYDKLFRIKIPGVIDVFTADAERYHVPRPLLNIVAYYTSIAEFFGGLFLLAGLCTTYALYALGLDLLLVGLAFSYMTPMWDMKFVFPRLALVVALLLLPENYRYFSLDYYIITR